MSKAPERAIPPQSNDDTISPITFANFLRHVLVTQKLEGIIVGLKEQEADQSADLTVQARQEIGELLGDLLVPAMKKGVIAGLREEGAKEGGELTAQARQEIGELLRDLLAPAMKEWSDTCKLTAAKIDELTLLVRRSTGETLDTAAQIAGPVKQRFLDEFPEEKKEIVGRLSEEFLSEETYCFLQASTTILHLAERLRSSGRGRNSLFYTNSTIFPYLMLGRDSAYKVYTLNGKQHDPLCCGWLYESNDSEAEAYLTKLFRRESDALNMAVVTPQYMTPEGVLLFAREETANLVRVLCSESNRLVILSPGQRLMDSEAQLPHSLNVWYEARIAPRDGERQQTVDLIVCGPTPNLQTGISAMFDLVKSGPGSLHYQEKPGERWQVPTTNSV